MVFTSLQVQEIGDDGSYILYDVFIKTELLPAQVMDVTLQLRLRVKGIFTDRTVYVTLDNLPVSTIK